VPSSDSIKSLKDILADIASIEQFTQGIDLKTFDENKQVTYAVKYALLRISEAAHRLGDTAAELCPDVPWRDIRGIGNRLRHAYDTIDAGLIWLVVKRDLVPLKTAIEAALRKIQAGGTGS
jgi:uncharacterized protein with HEPN domain